MKRYIFCLLIALFSIASYSQDVIKEGKTFKVQTTQTNEQQTEYTWEDKKGVKYPIFISKKGACYIKRISSKTGKEYKQYLSKEIQETIEKELKINKK
ncbi:MAG: hypothetical protein II344_07745 [Bacteroidales bacterium]|nr:hypothetical protein [Bacteroidales bacterium]